MKQLSMAFPGSVRVPTKYSHEQREGWVKKYLAGQSFRQIGDAEDVPHCTVSWYVRKQRGIGDGRKTGRKRTYPHLTPGEVQKQAVLRKNYGVTLEWFEAKEKEQEGLCAVCGKPPTAYANQHCSKVLNVDHDHATGKIRGLLCSHCNHGLGHFRDDPALLRAAAAYLEASRD